MLTKVPEDLVLTSGRVSLPKTPCGPIISTVRGDWVALIGPVWVTLDSMVMRNELDNISTHVIAISANESLLGGSILNFDEGDLKLGEVENSLNNCVHFDCCWLFWALK